jgi:hypothetical protein
MQLAVTPASGPRRPGTGTGHGDIAGSAVAVAVPGWGGLDGVGPTGTMVFVTDARSSALDRGHSATIDATTTMSMTIDQPRVIGPTFSFQSAAEGPTVRGGS